MKTLNIHLAKQSSILLIAISLFLVAQEKTYAQGGVGINAAGTPPNPSAILDASSTSKGELMPSMTAAQRDSIQMPAFGLIIFNTDCGVFNFNAGTPASPNWATLNSSNALAAGVSISANPVGAICAGSSVTFTATPFSGINSPNYQWQVNGGNVGANNSSYITTSLNNGDVVTCILSSNAPCVSGSPATSNSITMIVNPAPSTPGAMAGDTNVCAGTSGNVYSVSPVAGATSYTWTVPADASITGGQGSATITVTFGSDSGTINVTAMNTCASSSPEVQAVDVTSIPASPGAISGAANVSDYSSGNVYFISPVNAASSYIWTVPVGASITAGADADSAIITFGASGTGNITVAATNFCGTGSYDSLSITINPTIISFTQVGTTSWTPPAAVSSVQVLVVAGGGQGGLQASGGGAGGLIYNASYPVSSAQNYTVTVGAGGSGGNSDAGGGNGGNSVFGTLTAIGGGGGGPHNASGLSGGSGGGASWNGGTLYGGAGTAGQGNSGGGNDVNQNPYPGAGGGGAGGVGGSPPSTTVAGAGGAGLIYNISGAAVYYAGGGGGGGYPSCTPGAGGVGGGGEGGTSSNGLPGTPNTGGGGGGGDEDNGYVGGDGGSGIVVIEY